MEILSLLLTYYANAFIVLYFYLQSYFLEIVMMGLMICLVIIEFKEKEFLFVHDERKVV